MLQKVQDSISQQIPQQPALNIVEINTVDPSSYSDDQPDSDQRQRISTDGSQDG